MSPESVSKEVSVLGTELESVFASLRSTPVAAGSSSIQQAIANYLNASRSWVDAATGFGGFGASDSGQTLGGDVLLASSGPSNAQTAQGQRSAIRRLLDVVQAGASIVTPTSFEPSSNDRVLGSTRTSPNRIVSKAPVSSVSSSRLGSGVQRPSFSVAPRAVPATPSQPTHRKK